MYNDIKQELKHNCKANDMKNTDTSKWMCKDGKTVL